MMRNNRALAWNAPWLSTICGAVAAVIALGASGCGPITTTNNVAQARVAIAAAEAASAEKFAVYEYVSATEYLRKAREEEGFSDFQAAIDYALLSREFAEKAKIRAETDRDSQMPGAPMKAAPRPVPVVPGVVPVPTKPTPKPVGAPSGSSL